MKCFEIVTRVVVRDEATLMKAAHEQYDRDGGDGLILTAHSALEELSHFGDPFHPDGPRPALCCGVEIQDREVRLIHVSEPPVDPVGGVPPCFPPQVAQAHAAELRQALTDLLEWSARTRTGGPLWRETKELMTKIRDEEDAAREARR